MKKLLYILLPVVVLVVIAIVVITLLKGGINNNIEKNVARFKETVDAEDWGTFTYGKVDTGLLKQSMIINDLEFTIADDEAPEMTIKVKAAQMEIKSKDYKVNDEGMVEKLLVTFRDCSYAQTMDMGSDEVEGLELPGMEWVSSFSQSGMAADEVVIDFAGSLPEQFKSEDGEERLKEALLAFFSHDQVANIKLKGVKTSEETFSSPFYSLITDQQKKDFFTVDITDMKLSFNRADKMLKFEVPDVTQKHGSSSADFFIELDSDQMVESQDLKDIAIGKFKLVADCDYSGMEEIKLGDGKGMGAHSVGGVVYDIRAEGDLRMMDFYTLSADEEPDMELMKDVLNSFKVRYLYDISDLSIDFNTNPEEESRMGTYSAEKLKLDLGMDMKDLDPMTMMMSSMNVVTALQGGLEIKGLKGALTEELTQMATFMGVPAEVAKSPQIDSLVLDINSKDGVFDLSKNELVSNLGTIKLGGTFNMGDFSVDNGKVSFENCLPMIMGMISGVLPPEAQELLNPGDPSKQTLRVSGNMMEGLQFSN